MISASTLYLTLLIIGLFLFPIGLTLFFLPRQLIKWNAFGNTWLGRSDSALDHNRIIRFLFAANYDIFARYRITGAVLWVLSCIFIVVYILNQ